MTMLEPTDNLQIITQGPPSVLRKARGVLQRMRGKSASRVFWMLSDQAIISIGNFATANALARFLLPEAAFGDYQLLLQTLLFFNTLQAALVIYPLTIEAATSKVSGAQKSATAAIVFTLVMLPFLGLPLLRAGTMNSGAGVGAAAIVAMLFWQLQEATRRVLIAEFRIAACIPGDLISYFGQAALIITLHLTHRLNPAAAFLAIGVSSAAAMLVQAAQIGLGRVNWTDLRERAVSWWKLGGWTLLNSLSAVITTPAFFWVLRGRWGREAVATFSAISQPMNLMNPVTFSIGGLIVPAVARTLTTQGARAATRPALRYAGLGLLIVLPFYVVLFCVPHFSLRIFFGASSPYLASAGLLRLWALYTFIVTPTWILNAWLAGLKQSRVQFYGQLINTFAVLAISLPATYLFGIKGLILGGMISSSICMFALGYFLWRAILKLHHDHAMQPAAETVALA